MQNEKIPTRKVFYNGELVEFHLSSSDLLETAKQKYSNWEYLNSGYITYIDGQETKSEKLLHFFRMTSENQATYNQINKV